MKRRFGISIGNDKYEKIEEIAKRNKVTRSAIIERALDSYLMLLEHDTNPHDCCGLIVVMYKKEDNEQIREALSEDIVSTETHIHEGDKCIRISYVKGRDEKIEKAIMKIKNTTTKVFFLPLH